MRSIVVVTFLVLSYFGVVEGDDEKYPSKYDNIDYNEIVKSDRLLKNYVNCLMDRGTCTPEANELKHPRGDDSFLPQNSSSVHQEIEKCLPSPCPISKPDYINGILPEALETNCQKCTEPQKKGVFSVIKHMVHNKQNWWNELESKYDPDGVYWEKYKDQWKAEYDI